MEADRIFRVRAGYSHIPDFSARQYEGAGGKLILGTAAVNALDAPLHAAVSTGCSAACRVLAAS